VSRPTHGLRDWLLQRIGAVYLACYLGYLIVSMGTHPLPGFAEWHAWLTRPAMRVATAGFILALLVHGWVGMRDILLDYIRPLGLRLVALALVGLILAGSGLWGLQILVLAAA
jgi:succinate dehydrogenase / fumarate reductase membrane anchor subunit